jgi:putative glycosyl hydrolase-like family 15 (GHL15) protein
MRRRILTTLLIASFGSFVGLSRLAAAGNTMVSGVQPEIAGDAITGSPKVRLDAGLIRLGSGNWSGVTNANRYGVIVTSAANANSAGAQPGRVLLYACGSNTPPDQTSALCGVSFAYAAAKGWILKDDNQNYVHYRGQYPVLLDIGNRSYQQRFITDIINDLRAHPGIDGVMIDDVVGSLITASAKYPDNASYRDAMLSFLRAVGPALKAKGWYVGVNASILDGPAEAFTGPAWDGSQYIWWVRRIARYVDGINMEHWQQNWDSSASVRTSGPTGSQAWEGWQRVPSVVHHLGKDFYAMETGSLTDVGKASYLRASFLLAWKVGAGAFFYSDAYAGKGNPWRLVATPFIGRPAGPRRREGVGFRRTFTRGTVVVNPSPSVSLTFGFRRKYLMPDGTATTSVTLPPASGLVLGRS